jgi:ribosomal protein L11 methyltransferase
MSSTYDQPTYVVALEARAADLEDVQRRLVEMWGAEAVEFTRPQGDSVRLELYFGDEVEALLARSIVADDPRIRSAAVTRTLPADWETAFRKQFATRDVGRKLRIRPVWEQPREPRDDRIVLWIDPGLSFGTGTHFTTSFCLEMIDSLWLESTPASFLDVGTGSGLLAIAAARLDCEQVVAIENDDGVLPYTRKNLALNGVRDRVDLRSQDVRNGPLPGPADVVCANLFAGLLIDAASSLLQAARHRLILSGIRDVEADGVADTFQRLGGRELCRDGDGEWVGLMFGIGDD